jgi:gamma-butyrobetaine dioxygenase
MTPEEVAAFAANPWHRDLVALRRYDDEAKVPELPTPDLAHFRPLLSQHLGVPG